MTCPRINVSRSMRSFALAAAVATVAGCSMFRSADTGPDEAVEPIKPSTTQQTYSSSMNVPQALQPGNRPVVQDQLPLIYLVESNGTCRVTNVETGEEIATFAVKESQIVRVEKKGVLLANKQVLGAQLAAGTYAIEIVPEGAVVGQIRAQQTVSRAVLPSTTRPTTKPAAPRSVPSPARTPIDTPPQAPSSPTTDLPPPQ